MEDTGFLCDKCSNKERANSKRGNTYQGFKCKVSGGTLKFLSLKKECPNFTPITITEG